VAITTGPEPIGTQLAAQKRTTVKPARTHGRFVTFFQRLFKSSLDDNIDNIGAMLAYYAVLAIFPMLVFVATLGLLVLPADTINQGLAMAMEAVPASARALLTERVSSLVNHASSGFAIVTVVIALWGASRGAVAMQLALNSLYQKKETRSWIRRQLIAIAVTLGVAALVVTALALLVVGPAAGHLMMDRFGLGDTFDLVWSIGRWVGAGLLVMFVWAVVYKFLPNTDAPFRVFTPGAFVGVLLWLGVSYLFGLYLTHFGSYEATYGALGGAIIFLTWIWISNIALLFGAEINDVLADLRAERSDAAAQLADPAEHKHDYPAK